MILKIYVIKDKLVGFGGPIAMQDEKTARRMFESYCKRKKNEEYCEAKYFELYETGTYDTEKGTMVGYPESGLQLIMEGEGFDEQKN